MASPAVITLRADDDPLLVVGRMDGSREYQLHDVEGPVCTLDRGTILGVRGVHEVRRSGSDGTDTGAAG